MIERHRGVRYVLPLREGGSLPAVVETENGDAYVVKFRGAGQGPKALIAELLAAAIAQALALPVPTLALIALADDFGAGEPDPEIQDILRGSVGLNVGLAFLSGALAFDPAVDTVDPDLAAAIVWFDAFITNVDRTVRNTNLLIWRERLWLIDHGASLYFHHRWEGWQERIHNPFPQIKDHVLLYRAGDLAEADARLRSRLTEEILAVTVDGIPEEWLDMGATPEGADAARSVYRTYLSERLNGARPWLQEAIDAQQREPPILAPRLTHRVL